MSRGISRTVERKYNSHFRAIVGQFQSNLIIPLIDITTTSLIITAIINLINGQRAIPEQFGNDAIILLIDIVISFIEMATLDA